MILAPIILFVYNRPRHTRQTIESLQKNLLARESELFIFSDGPKNESDEKNVAEVRNYIKTIGNFKNVTLEKSEVNNGLANSVIDGVTKILKKSNKVIVLEDDLVLATGFLEYMNNGLEFYKNQNKIFSLTGYCPPVKIPTDYKEDVFFSSRAASWGWATYHDRWALVDWNIEIFNEFNNNKITQRNFNKWGEDLTPMLKAQFYNLIDSWAVRWSYAHYRNDSYCVYPVRSLVRNTGTDSSGTHFSKTKKYDVKLSEFSRKVNFPESVKTDDRILGGINDLVKPSIIRKMINYFKFRYLSMKPLRTGG